MKIILLGAPGSGKGTLAKLISKDFSLPQISTGDLFRECVKSESEFAKKVQAIMASGNLVPDEITVELVKNRIAQEDCQNGFILDGFPRSVAQAQALKEITLIDAIILLDVSNETVIERLSTRRTCPGCKEIYNTRSYNKNECSICGATLIQRDDDKPEAIRHRLEVYETSTSPLINFYSGRLFKVSADSTPEETYRPVKTFLEKLEAKSE